MSAPGGESPVPGRLRGGRGSGGSAGCADVASSETPLRKPPGIFERSTTASRCSGSAMSGPSTRSPSDHGTPTPTLLPAAAMLAAPPPLPHSTGPPYGSLGARGRLHGTAYSAGSPASSSGCGGCCGWHSCPPGGYAGQSPASSSDSHSSPLRAPPGLMRPVPPAPRSHPGLAGPRAVDASLAQRSPLCDPMVAAAYAAAQAAAAAAGFRGAFAGWGLGCGLGACAGSPIEDEFEEYCPGELLTKTSRAAGSSSSSSAALAPQGRSPGTKSSAAAPTSAGGASPGNLLEEDDESDEESPGSPSQDAQAGHRIPTVGSAGHEFRLCKPCAFVNTKGCKDGAECRFCHLCGPGEKKRRKKEKSAFWRTVNRWQRGGPTRWA